MATSEQTHIQKWKTYRFLILAATCLAGLWLLIVQPARMMGKGVDRRIDQVLESITGEKSVIVAGKASIEKKTNITELALIELSMSTVRSLENEAFLTKYLSLGTKRIELQGRFRVKAGYNLNDGFELYESGGKRVIAKTPAPKILSVELIELRTLREEDGWLNKVTPEDRDALIKDLRDQMEHDAATSGLLENSEMFLKMRLKDLIGGRELEIQRL